VANADRPGGYRPGADYVSAFDLMRAAPRCGARIRRGTSCMAPAMPNGRCRMHEGRMRKLPQPPVEGPPSNMSVTVGTPNMASVNASGSSWRNTDVSSISLFS
jgi:hypothetical protein